MNVIVVPYCHNKLTLVVGVQYILPFASLLCFVQLLLLLQLIIVQLVAAFYMVASRLLLNNPSLTVYKIGLVDTYSRIPWDPSNF